jgi:hypothetical protein
MNEPIAGPSGSGTVLLELGQGVGALVLRTPAKFDGAEIEISRREGGRTHSCVRPRHTSGGTSYAAVYPDLAAGEYLVLLEETPVLAVRIAGGAVTSASLPSPASRAVGDGEGKPERHTAHRHDRDGDDQQPLGLGGALA